MLFAIVVWGTAISVFFSQEFVRMFKKIWAIKGIKLILFMAIASGFTYTFNDKMLQGIYFYQKILNILITFLTQMIPLGKLSFYVALILLLTTISVLPVALLNIVFQKRTCRLYPSPYLTSTFIWVVSVLILVVLQNN